MDWNSAALELSHIRIYLDSNSVRVKFVRSYIHLDSNSLGFEFSYSVDVKFFGGRIEMRCIQIHSDHVQFSNSLELKFTWIRIQLDSNLLRLESSCIQIKLESDSVGFEFI